MTRSYHQSVFGEPGRPPGLPVLFLRSRLRRNLYERFYPQDRNCLECAQTPSPDKDCLHHISSEEIQVRWPASPFTRFAALKTKHEGLVRRVTLFEELFGLLLMRSEAETVEIIGRMRTVNTETDSEDRVKFIKNADLLMQLASA
ncbi:hypothetical protein CORC01_14360 [Colletotrichum orchidophilum]|uniref:Uncharacterized protein n=1 Tax=Colletotrichum orchidophilum TaxID=1209926 RepID=A0A1G4AMF5_9PEZI|nr:uncharacterized protein CORC01_14360 [Colletotrichum orchidophilum]OHE90347.1 hypothetical protein CORC01_14360 [Colletotrichum orchidophilum]